MNGLYFRKSRKNEVERITDFWRTFMDLSGIPPHMAQLFVDHEPDPLERLSHKILNLVRDHLVLKMPYFNRAILKMPEYYYLPEDFSGWLDREGQPAIPAGMGTNGQVLFVNPDALIEGYKESPERICHTYLHLLLHCIYRHPFQYEKLDMEAWDLASDLAAEDRLLSLELPETALEDDGRRRSVLGELSETVGKLTAERIYHSLRENEDLREDLLKNKDLFHFDLHQFWMSSQKEGNGESNQDGRMIMADPDTEESWKKIGAQTKLNISNKEENMGMTPNDLVSEINEVSRDDKDYTDFLRGFARMTEEVHLDPDSFDYIYYHYGMELYGNLPLIEPLEYRDAPKICDFVIAIDTSGSCQGNAVRAFLNRTYSILKNTEIFTQRMNLHIIQCDCEIQKDVRIEDEEDFDRYMQSIEIHGGGGTDFRPVFSYVKDQVNKGEYYALCGLLYFTDGLGMFPEEEPDFKTAFILKESGGVYPETPDWALTYQLSGQEMEELELASDSQPRQGVLM